MEFGDLLRQLRTEKGLGLKRLAPDLGVTPGYLSKLENNLLRPSDELVERTARYFDYDQDVLLLSASRIPPDVLRMLRTNPEEAISYLRARFGGSPRDEAGTAPEPDRG